VDFCDLAQAPPPPPPPPVNDSTSLEKTTSNEVKKLHTRTSEVDCDKATVYESTSKLLSKTSSIQLSEESFQNDNVSDDVNCANIPHITAQPILHEPSHQESSEFCNNQLEEQQEHKTTKEKKRKKDKVIQITITIDH
jgi:hypothetical protein